MRVSRRGDSGIHEADAFLKRLLRGSRILMCLIAVVMAIAPWTEHFASLDSFPHGQDVELSVLAFLALLCLVLLLALLRKQGWKDLFSEKTWHSLVIWKLGKKPDRECGRIARDCNSPPLRSIRTGAYNLPLQI